MDACFRCPSCDRPVRTSVAAPQDWQCPGCEHRQHVPAVDGTVSECVVCGNVELFKKKNFPHTLGMTILVVACVTSFYTYFWYDKWLTYAILIGSALVDGVLYLLVGDAVVCYRCDAHYTGMGKAETHEPFELTIGERYRQQRLRAESRPRT